jgi:hypothetical protein
MSEGQIGNQSHMETSGFEIPRQVLEAPYLFQGNLQTHRPVQQYRMMLLRRQEMGEKPVRYAAT